MTYKRMSEKWMTLSVPAYGQAGEWILKAASEAKLNPFTSLFSFLLNFPVSFWYLPLTS